MIVNKLKKLFSLFKKTNPGKHITWEKLKQKPLKHHPKEYERFTDDEQPWQ